MLHDILIAVLSCGCGAAIGAYVVFKTFINRWKTAPWDIILFLEKNINEEQRQG